MTAMVLGSKLPRSGKLSPAARAQRIGLSLTRMWRAATMSASSCTQAGIIGRFCRVGVHFKPGSSP